MKSARLGRGLAALGAIALALAAPARDARANGAFPASGQILVDPAAPETIWVATTYGFAKTKDAGATFHLVCEAGIGYSSGYHPHAAVTPTGAIFMGLSDGLAIGRGDTCAFERATELEGNFVTDVSVSPDGRAIALVIPPNDARPSVWASDDDLASFAQLGALLPPKMTPLTLDAAPSDPDVLYVSALSQGTMIHGTILVSQDAGATWSPSVVPGSDAIEVAPFIAAIDPFDPGRLWVRLNGIPGRLLLSEDFGATFTEVTTTRGFLHAFKLSADGSTAYFGGSMDGLARLDTETLEVTPLAPLSTRCVALHDDRVFACGDEGMDGFSAGASSDGGLTFEPLLVNRCIEGILPCDAGDPVHDLCEPAWPGIRDLIGAEGDCDGSPGGGGAGAGGAPSTGGRGAAGGSSTSNGGGPPGSGGSGGGPGDGCACSARGTSDVSLEPLVLAAGIIVVARRLLSRPSRSN